MVTFVGRGNPFGGPVAVMEEQVAKLSDRGFTLTVAAMSDGLVSAPAVARGAEAVIMGRPVPGSAGWFSGMLAPRTLMRTIRSLPAQDVVHVHLARDLFSMLVALACRARRVPYVVQPHGMLVPKSGLLARIYDALLTGPVLRGARRVFYLTERERTELAPIKWELSDRNLVPLSNGVVQHSPPLSSRRPYATFASRLNARKRPLLFLKASQVAERPRGVRFLICGPDGGELAALRRELENVPRERRPLLVGGQERPRVLNLLALSKVLVLPSLNEPFPMIALEALSVGTPVVLCESCGIADDVAAYGAGLILADEASAGDVAAAVAAICGDENTWMRMHRAAAQLVREKYGIDTVVSTLAGTYRTVVDE
ncbi:glycosyltransferase [Blastococcus sp. TF02A-35]|nr:glycosyltransferase [Blastococcus sp. TF02A_35]TFV53718.1 glycosyltransferase [Blastococcus sp. TF02A_35]